MTGRPIPADVLYAFFSELGKEAGVFSAIGAGGRAAGRAAVGGAKRVGEFAMKHPKTTAALGVGALGTGYVGLKAVQGAKQGYKDMSYGALPGTHEYNSQE